MEREVNGHGSEARCPSCGGPLCVKDTHLVCHNPMCKMCEKIGESHYNKIEIEDKVHWKNAEYKITFCNIDTLTLHDSDSKTKWQVDCETCLEIMERKTKKGDVNKEELVRREKSKRREEIKSILISIFMGIMSFFAILFGTILMVILIYMTATTEWIFRTFIIALLIIVIFKRR